MSACERIGGKWSSIVYNIAYFVFTTCESGRILTLWHDTKVSYVLHPYFQLTDMLPWLLLCMATDGLANNVTTEILFVLFFLLQLTENCSDTRVRWPPAVGGGTATRRYARRRSINELRMRSAGNREEDAGYVY